MTTNPKLYFISRDSAGCFGCRWIVGTEFEARLAGYIWPAYTRELTPSLLAYLRGVGLN